MSLEPTDAHHARPADDRRARVHLRVAGRVQGVGFRRAVQRHALRLGVGGWVRNLASGDVEIAASGDPAVLDAFRRAVVEATAPASVSNVAELAPVADDELVPFAIRETAHA